MSEDMITDPVQSAFAYWRGDDFWFCCGNDECTYDKTDQDAPFGGVKGVDDFSCHFEVPEHGYAVSIWSDGSWSPRALDDLSVPYYPTEDERLFWQQMAKCYTELPTWYKLPLEQLEKYSSGDSGLCTCPTSLILSKGCQCGGA